MAVDAEDESKVNRSGLSFVGFGFCRDGVEVVVG